MYSLQHKNKIGTSQKQIFLTLIGFLHFSTLKILYKTFLSIVSNQCNRYGKNIVNKKRLKNFAKGGDYNPLTPAEYATVF